jgi:membrane protein
MLGFTRTLQRTCQAAWALPPQGIRGVLQGLLGAVVLVGEVILTVVVGSLLRNVPNDVLVVSGVRLVLAVLLWWSVQRLLLGGRVGWRRLLPGALVLGAGQVVVTAVSGLYLQPAIEDHARRYGLIGVAFVLVSWLIGLGLLLVVGTVLSAEMAHHPQAVPGAPRPEGETGTGTS